MARTPMITRTVKATKATVMCVDISTGNTFTQEVTLPRTYKDDNEILKKAKAIIDTQENTKAVHIISTEINEALYGMTEDKFIENAEILPPRKIYEEITKENG